MSNLHTNLSEHQLNTLPLTLNVHMCVYVCTCVCKLCTFTFVKPCTSERNERMFTYIDTFPQTAPHFPKLEKKPTSDQTHKRHKNFSQIIINLF